MALKQNDEWSVPLDGFRPTDGVAIPRIKIRISIPDLPGKTYPWVCHAIRGHNSLRTLSSGKGSLVPKLCLGTQPFEALLRVRLAGTGDYQSN